mgnify:CR=1 FL=1
MKKITKRIFSAILSAIMLILALPLTGFASSKTYVDYGDIIEFGSYPQTQVKDTELIKKLDNIGKSWRSYGYYSGNGEYGSMAQGDWMKYADFKYDGNKYRAVTFSQYRPASTIEESSEKNSCQYDNGYYINNVYYFLYEPLKWRALTFQSDGVYLICDSIIDSQPFNSEVFHYYYSEGVGHHYLYNRQVENCRDTKNRKYLADYYSTSSLKEWTENTLFKTVFSKYERTKITSIKYEEDSLYQKYNEFLNYDQESYLNSISAETDYARSQGLGSTVWWSGLAVDTEYEMSGYYANINIMNNKRLRMYNFYHQAVVPYDSSIGVRPVIFYKGITENKLGTVKATVSSSTVYLGETATVRVTVNSSPEKLRFVNRYNDSYTVTIDRNNIRVKSIEKYSDNTEVWYVNLNVNADSITYDVYAKYSGRGWYMIQYPCSFILEAQERVPDKDVYSFSIDECYDDVMYAGVHKVTVETGVDATKVQFYKDGNTWTYSADNASYVIEDDKKIWSINMNFSELGEDMEYYIRTRSQKSAFEFTDQVMNVWVRFK